jgi:hypothetical protein
MTEIEASQAWYDDKLGRSGVRKKYENKAVASCADEVKRYDADEAAQRGHGVVQR